MPLSEERLTALRQSIKIHRDQLDNNFLVRGASQNNRQVEPLSRLARVFYRFYCI